MNNIWKRGLSLFLAVVMVMGAVPMSVFATEEIVEETSAPVELVQEETGNAEETTEETPTPEEEVSAPAEESSAPAEETPADEEPLEDEETLDGKEALAEVATHGSKEKPYGIVWVNALDEEGNERDSETIGLELVFSGLRAKVLETVGRADDVSNKAVKVLFQGEDTGDIFSLMKKQDELIDAFGGDENTRAACFTIDGENYWIGIKKIQSANVVVRASVSNKGVPANLSNLVSAALNNPVIEINHGGNNWYTETVRREDAVELSSKTINAVWPAAGGTKTYKNAVTVTVYDTLRQAPVTVSGDLVLVDTTETVAITYMLTEAEEWKTVNVFEGEDAPFEIPNRTYYTFQGWKDAQGTVHTDETKALATNVTEALTFVAQWQPGIDADNNGTDDREQTFTITYTDGVEGEEIFADYTKELKYGSALKHPTSNDIPQLAQREGYNFRRWTYVEGSTSAIVKGNATYKAVWDEVIVAPPVEPDPDEPEQPTVPVVETVTVKYFMQDPETLEEFVITEEIVKNEKATRYPSENNGDGYAYLGWYEADENGNLVGITNSNLPPRYDFDAPVTADLYLRLVYGIDENNNGHIDGGYMFNPDGTVMRDANGDPMRDVMAVYKYMHHNGVQVIRTVTVSNETAFDASKLQGVAYSYSKAGYKFAGWALANTEDNGAKIIYTIEPQFGADANKNGVFDANETVGIIVNEQDLADYLAENPGAITVTIDGEAVTDTIAMFNTQAGAEIVVSGGSKTYIAGMVATDIADAVAMGLNLNVDANEVSGWLQDAGKETVNAEMNTSGLPAYLIEISVASISEKKLADGEAHLNIAGGKYIFTAEEIYDSVMASPSRTAARAAAAVSVTYLARDTQTVSVNVDALYDWFESNYTEKMSSVLDQYLNIETKAGHHIMTISLPKVWKNVNDTTIERKVLAPQDVANDVINSYINNFVATLKDKNATDEALSDLLVDLGGLKFQIEQDVKNYANIHPFAYNAEGAASFAETVNISYVNGDYGFTKNGITVKLADGRKDAALAVTKKSVSYGASDAQILQNVTSASGNVEMAVSFNKQSAGTYYGVSAVFTGNGEYKPGRVTFDLTINRQALDLAMDSTILVKLENETELKNYNPAPKNAPAGADIVSVIAGLDLNGMDLGLGSLQSPGTADNMDLKIWVKIPATVKNLLTVIKKMADVMDSSEEIEYVKKLSLDDQHFNTWNEAIAEIEKILDLANVSVSQVESVLNWIQNQNHFDGGVDLMFSNSYPTVPGVYANGAIEIDVNYDEPLDQDHLTNNVGIIGISPALVKPNQGGVQLYHANDGAENIYEDHSNGQPFELIVKHNGVTVDADVYYYGFDNTLSVHFYGKDGAADDGKCAPTLPGVYLASTVYNKDGKRIGSDMALIIIGVEITETTVTGKSIPADGEMHTVDIKVVEDPDNSGKVINPGKTIISGYVGNDAEEASAGLAAVKAELNIDFPETLDNLWNNKFVPNFKQYTGVALPDSIKVSHVVKFLEKCLEWNDEQALENILNKLPGIDAKYTEKFPNAAAERVINELLTAVRKLDGALEVTFHDTYKNGALNFGYSDYGVYAYYVVVTDPNYVPSSDTGLLILKNGEFAVLDTIHPYTGDAYLPSIVDGSNRDELMVVSGIFNGEKAINFILDDDLKTLVDNKLGRAIDGMTIGELRDKATGKANALSTAIIEAIIEKEKAYLTGSEELADILLKLNEREKAYKTELISKLTDRIIAASALIESEDDVILLNEPIVDVGTYQVQAFSYALAYDYGTLTIAPVYPRIAADNLSKERGTEDPEKLTWTMSYYSYVTAEDGTVTEISMDLPANVTVNVDAKLVREPGEEVGEYAINFESVTFNGPDFMPDEIKPEDMIPGIFTIYEPEITGEINGVSASLRLKSEVHINVAFDITGFEGLENIEEKMGLLVWRDNSIPMDECDITNADEIIRGGEFHSGYGKYVVRTNGISATNMGRLDNTIYFKVFIQTGENTYVYSPYRYKYSPQHYCENKVSGNNPEDLKQLCVALMNYGAAAQVYFAEEGEYTLPATLMNDVACFNNYQSKLKTYTDSMVDTLGGFDKTKHVNFKADTTQISRVQSFMSTTGALQLNFHTTVANMNYTEAGILVWPEEAYNNADVLTWENATKIASGAAGAAAFESRFTGIAAKDMGMTVYGCSYIKVDGEYKYYGIYRNSIDAYAKSMIYKADSTTALKDLMKATVVYGEYAKTYFANNEDNSN